MWGSCCYHRHFFVEYFNTCSVKVKAADRSNSYSSNLHEQSQSWHVVCESSLFCSTYPIFAGFWWLSWVDAEPLSQVSWGRCEQGWRPASAFLIPSLPLIKPLWAPALLSVRHDSVLPVAVMPLGAFWRGCRWVSPEQTCRCMHDDRRYSSAVAAAAATVS